MAAPSERRAATQDAQPRTTQEPRRLVTTNASGRLSIIPSCVYDDTRMGPAAQRMLGVLGTYADTKTGMCRPDQRTLSARLGISRQAVSKALRALAAAGYIEIIARYSDFNGARLASHYRLVMDVDVPAEYRRTPPQPDVDGGQAEIDTPQSDVETPRNLTLHPPQREVAYPRNVALLPPQPDVASVKNDPVKNDSDERPRGNDVAADAASARASIAARDHDQASILRGLSAEARQVLDAHRRAHGRRIPAKLTPESARVLEEAVADLGINRLEEAIRYMAGKIPAVPELSKAIRAARTKRERDEGADATRSRPAHGRESAPATPRPGSIAARTKSERFSS